MENEIMTTTQQAQSTLLATAEIKGTTVQNRQNEDIGDVDELLIRHEDGVVRLAVLSVGGFLGLGSTKVAVPWTAFDIETLRDGTIKMILDAMAKSLADGQRIEIRGFGSFGLNYRPPRTGRNPKSGEKVQVPAKYVPHFKAGKELRERVDLKKD